VKVSYKHRIKSGDKRYIWQEDDWPQWAYDDERLAPLLAQLHLAQGNMGYVRKARLGVAPAR